MISKTKKYFKLSLIFFIICMLIPIITSKYIIATNFALDKKDIKEITKLTSKVFKSTNYKREGFMDESRLLSGFNIISNTHIDQELTAYFYFFYQTLFNYFKLDGYQCGGVAKYLKKILDEHEVKSFIYNFGTNGPESHVVNIVEINDNLYLFDAHYNVVYKNKKEYLSFKELLNIVKDDKELINYISTINPDDKVFDWHLKLYKNYSPSDVINFFDLYKKIGKKKHILLDKSEFYFSSENSRNYFFSKYSYLKQL